VRELEPATMTLPKKSVRLWLVLKVHRMNTQELANLQSSSVFQQAIESLPLETQEALIRVVQNRLREKRRSILMEAVTDSEKAYAAGNVRRGSAADLLAELED
jgi:hypothetical protein